jgi:hypothetical protein
MHSPTTDSTSLPRSNQIQVYIPNKTEKKEKKRIKALPEFSQPMK